MTTPAIRTPTSLDVERIKQLAIATEMFGLDEVGFFDELLAGFFDRSSADHRWLVAEDAEGGVVAAAHYAAEPFADRMYARTRAFYRHHGFDEEARIRQFYGPDDDKVVFWKSLGHSHDRP